MAKRSRSSRSSSSSHPRSHETGDRGVTRSTYFGVFQQVRTPKKVYIRPLWGRLAALLAVLCLVGWLAASGVFYYVWKEKKEYPNVEFLDMVTLKFMGKEYKEKVGTYHIEKGLDLLEKEEYVRAQQMLSLGLARNPNHVEGALIYAQFIHAHRPDRAIQFMKRTVELTDRDHPKYEELLRKTLLVMIGAKEDQQVIELAEEMLPPEPNPRDPIQQLLGMAAAKAHYYRGNFEEAESYIVDYQLNATTEGILLWSRIFWERGDKELARGTIRKALDQVQQKDALFQMLDHFLRDSEMYEEALKNASYYAVMEPENPLPRIASIHSNYHLGKTDRLGREVDRIIEDFSDDVLAMQALADFATDTGQTDLALRLYRLAEDKAEAGNADFKPENFALLMIESHISAEEYDKAVELAERIEDEDPEWLEQAIGVFDSLRSVAYFGVGNEDLGSHYQSRFFEGGKLPTQTIYAVARRYRKLGYDLNALNVLKEGHRRYPAARQLLLELVDVELDLGNTENLPKYLTEMMKMRRPPTDLLQKAYRTMSSDRFLFAENRRKILDDIEEAIAAAKETDPAKRSLNEMKLL